MFIVWGKSVNVGGGYEGQKITHTPSKLAGANRWTLVAPVRGKMAYVDIINGNGGMPWDRFYAIGKKIMLSVR